MVGEEARKGGETLGDSRGKISWRRGRLEIGRVGRGRPATWKRGESGWNTIQYSSLVSSHILIMDCGSLHMNSGSFHLIEVEGYLTESSGG